MRPEDAAAADECATRAFEDLGERVGRSWPAPSAEDRMAGRARLAHIARQDPHGCWVGVTGDGMIAGAGMAILREGFWGLSLLVVDPAHQGAGIGARLLGKTLKYAEDSHGGMILSSDDPRAIRQYARAGFELHPAMIAMGAVDHAALPGTSGVRGGGLADLCGAEEIGRELRGASHGGDLRALLDSGARMHVVPERGFAFQTDGTPKLLAARDEDAARSLLLCCLAQAPDGKECMVAFLSAQQGWALDVLFAAGLDVSPGGPVFVRGKLGPLTPYIPNGAFL